MTPRFWHCLALRFVGRRKAAFLVGVVVATPVVIMGTARAYADNPTKGWVSGVLSYGIVLVVAL